MLKDKLFEWIYLEIKDLFQDIFMNYTTRATAAMEILAFTLFIPVGYRKLMEFKSNLTSLSVMEFLEYGEKRFVYWRRDSWVLIPYLLLLGGALNITIHWSLVTGH